MSNLEIAYSLPSENKILTEATHAHLPTVVLIWNIWHSWNYCNSETGFLKKIFSRVRCIFYKISLHSMKKARSYSSNKAFSDRIVDDLAYIYDFFHYQPNYMYYFRNLSSTKTALEDFTQFKPLNILRTLTEFSAFSFLTNERFICF